MSSSNSLKVLFLLIIVGVLGSTLGVVGTGAVPFKMIQIEEAVLGSGSAGSGSLAVAALFSVSASSGAGAFSGDLHASLGYDTGLFRLTVSNPPDAPILPCPMGQVSASGSVTSGSFPGEQVLVAGCIGSGVPGAFIIYHNAPSNPDFSGQGTGTAVVLSESLRGGVVAAGVTSGSGSAGSGTIYTAEADAVAKDGNVVGGGALTGTVSDIQSENTWQTNKASLQPGCTLTTSGVSAPYSFPGEWRNQPVSSSYTLVICPPASTGPQTARFVYVVGGDASPTYKGTGSAIMSLFGYHFID